MNIEMIRDLTGSLLWKGVVLSSFATFFFFLVKFVIKKNMRGKLRVAVTLGKQIEHLFSA